MLLKKKPTFATVNLHGGIYGTKDKTGKRAKLAHKVSKQLSQQRDRTILKRMLNKDVRNSFLD
jgi:hypothetical protein